MATQAERTASTRRLLLDATVGCLVEKGYAGTTTADVADRAGVSRGALVHHFPSKADLVVASLQHLADLRRTEVSTVRGGSTLAGLEQLAAMFSGPFFAAWTELWVAARTDPGLHVALLPFEQKVSQNLFETAADLLGLSLADAEDRVTVQLTLEMLRGLGTAGVLADPAAHARTQRVLLRRWAASDLGRRPVERV